MKSAENIISDAKAGLVLRAPFFASILLQHEWKEDKETKTWSTDGKTLRWNREFTESLTLRETMGLGEHEAAHVALMHHTRKGDRDHDRWNRACDYAINIALVDAKSVLPKGALLDERFRNMDAESIYRTLQQENDKDTKPGGKAANGNGPGEVLPAPGGKAGQAEAEAQAKVMVSQAKRMAEKCGHMPGSIGREVDNALEPTIPWLEKLARFIEETSNRDYSMMNPNKRYLQQGFVLPGLYSKVMGAIWLVIDTSGSITIEEVRVMISELLGVISMYIEQGTTPKLNVIYCDSKVQHVEYLESELDTPNPKGGGGTDFKPPFDWLDKEGVRPRALVYLTDGECHSFPIAPHFPVLWGLIRRNDRFNPPFGETFKAYT